MVHCARMLSKCICRVGIGKQMRKLVLRKHETGMTTEILTHHNIAHYMYGQDHTKKPGAKMRPARCHVLQGLQVQRPPVRSKATMYSNHPTQKRRLHLVMKSAGAPPSPGPAPHNVSHATYTPSSTLVVQGKVYLDLVALDMKQFGPSDLFESSLLLRLAHRRLC